MSRADGKHFMYGRGPAGNWSVLCPYCRQQMDLDNAGAALQAAKAHELVCKGEPA